MKSGRNCLFAACSCIVASALLTHSQPIASEDPGRVFARVYSTHEWGTHGGGSGIGSTINATHSVREILREFFKRNDVHAMADVPCGSFHWMKLVIQLNKDVKYVGLDAAAQVIKGLQEEFAPGKSEISDRISFKESDFSKDALPKEMDVIFSRDALQHLAPLQILAALRAFRAADPRFLLVGSYPQGANAAIPTGAYFLINLMRAPFDLWPSEIFSESSGDPGAIKLVLVYRREDLAGWDLDAVEERVRAAFAIRP